MRRFVTLHARVRPFSMQLGVRHKFRGRQIPATLSRRRFTMLEPNKKDTDREGSAADPKLEHKYFDSSVKVDNRVYPIAISSLFMGVSMNVVLPLLPIFATQIGLSFSQLGMTLSIVGLARMFTNLPLTSLCDKYGRRPFLILGALLSGASTCFLGCANNLPMLLIGRLGQGMGGSAQFSAATLYVTDISTPWNRARTLAPLMVSWSAGGMIGPWLGGVLADSFGVRTPFFVVGGIITGISMWNWWMLPETLRGPRDDTPLATSLIDSIKQWREISKDSSICLVVGVHSTFWMLFSGAVHTCLPIFLTSELGTSATSVGTCFMLVAAVNVFGSQPAAWLSDKFGRKALIVPGGALIVAGVALLPFSSTLNEVLAALGLFAVGNCLQGGNLTAYAADISSHETRSQALALIRTGGDFGLMLGAATVGLVADMFGLSAAMHVVTASYGIVLASFALRAREPPR